MDTKQNRHEIMFHTGSETDLPACHSSGHTFIGSCFFPRTINSFHFCPPSFAFIQLTSLGIIYEVSPPSENLSNIMAVYGTEGFKVSPELGPNFS